MARVGPSNKAPVVRASRDDEVEACACVRASLLGANDAEGARPGLIDASGKSTKTACWHKKTPFWLIWSDS